MVSKASWERPREWAARDRGKELPFFRRHLHLHLLLRAALAWLLANSLKWRACSQAKHQLFTVLPQTLKKQPMALNGAGRGGGGGYHNLLLLFYANLCQMRLKKICLNPADGQSATTGVLKEKNKAGCDKDNHVHPWVPMRSQYTLVLVAIDACMCTVICKNTDYVFNK